MGIYFDNCASTHPKPEEVYQAQDRYLRQGGNPGRASHLYALESARSVFEARSNLASLLEIGQVERLIFTSGCTQSINMVLKGLKWSKNDTVVVLPLAHNAVMRPLYQLEQGFGIWIARVPYVAGSVLVLDALSAMLRDLRPRLCIATEASNVTGQLIDLPRIADICHQWKVPLLVDAAQSAGWTEARIDSLGVSFWCASGHKGLMGPPGVGVLFVKEGVELEPLVSGGTGSLSESLEMPSYFPDRFEAGTLAGPAIAGLGAAADWLQKTGLAAVRAHELMLTEWFLNWACTKDWIQIYGPVNVVNRTSVVSFSLARISAGCVADLLDRDFGIAVRSGLHCASEAHRALGTLDTGLVRVSFGYFNTRDEVDKLCEALETLTFARDVD